MTAAPQARTVGFQPGERNVFFHLLTACNLRCRHCYINPAEHGTATLPLATVQRWLKLFARPERETTLILLGGEPTLHPDLAAIIRAAKSLRYAVTVDSNGYLFHDLLDRVTPQEVDYLSFSLDGPDAAVNDPIRGEGVFALCTANIRRAVAAGFNASCIYTVSGLNIDHLHRMPALLEDLAQRGLLEDTLVLVSSEMGRKPLIGDRRSGGVEGAGRDHWTACMSVLLAGGGIRGGQVYGETDRFGEYPAGKPLSPADITRTVYHAMGIHDLAAVDREGRPFQLLDQGRPLVELF